MKNGRNEVDRRNDGAVTNERSAAWRPSLLALAGFALTVPATGAAQEAGYGPPAPKDVAAEASFAAIPAGIDDQLALAARRMLADYPSLEAARRTVRAGDYEVEAANWLRYPSVDVSLSTSDERLGLARPAITIFQPIWAGGRISAGIARGNASREIARARLDEVAFDLLLRLAQSYYEIGRTARLVEIYRQSVTEHRRLVESMQRRVAQEVSPRTDLELALSRTAQTEQELALLETQEGIARARFAELSGLPGMEIAPPAYDEPSHHAVSDYALERAVACNPTVRRFDAEIALAEAELRLSKAAILPQVGAQYVHDRFGGEQIGLAVRATTDGGLSALSLSQAAGARRDASRFAADTAQREVREAVALDLIENRAARARIASSALAADSSLNVTNSYLRQFVAGRRTWLDVMNSVREAVAARAALVEAETSAMSSSARIHLGACEWVPGPAEGSGE